MIAALYVIRDGPYSNLPDIDAWPEERDARTYAGPHPVIAHPPCARWGRYWSKAGAKMGEDGGCFKSALESVQRWGGILEHPEGSHAWPAFGISKPPRTGGWIRAGLFIDGWTCCVEQGHYGHRARKPTWLYFVGQRRPPELRWGPSDVDPRYRIAEDATPKERKRAVRMGVIQRLSKRQRKATPIEFRDLLISIVRSQVA